MAEYTTNLNLEKQQSNEYINIEGINENFDKIDNAIGNSSKFEKAGGTATAITLTNVILEDGVSKTFIVGANNISLSTKINGKPLYKPNTTSAPTLSAGKAVTVWYDVTGDCFFIKASATGTVTSDKVLAGETYSTEEDTEVVGTMKDNGAVEITPSTTNKAIPVGYHDGNGYVMGSPYLISENIRQQVTIFGVSGHANVVNTGEGTATKYDVLEGKKAYVKGKLITGTISDRRGSTDVYNGGVYKTDPPRLSFKIGEGYYDGSSYLFCNDSNFKAENIKDGVSIFGVNGSFTGIRFASGTVKSSSTDSTFSKQSGTVTRPYIILTQLGLTFSPSYVMIFSVDGSITIYATFELYRDSGNVPYYIYTSGYSYLRNGQIGYIPVSSQNTAYQFVAWE